MPIPRGKGRIVYKKGSEVDRHNSQVFINSLARALERSPRWIFSRAIQMALDGLAATAALLVALFVRFDFHFSRIYPGLILWVPVIAIVRPLLLRVFSSYQSTWRHFHLADGVDLVFNAAPLTASLILLRAVVGFRHTVPPLPYSVAIMEWTLFIGFAGFLRILRRLTYAAVHSDKQPIHRAILVSDDVLISGAVRLVEPYRDIQLVGIITNEESMHGRTVAGVPVLGSTSCLQQSLISHRAELVLMTSSGVQRAEEIVAQAVEFGFQVHIIPTARDLVRERVRVSQSLQIEQVIDRFQPVNLEPHPAVVSCLHERCVLVTGAGGSIGSEIARQVAFLPVSKLILLDQDENSIFELMNELQISCAKIVPFVGDIRDEEMIHELFSLHKPDVVLHAAAYKHVPVMEANPCEAVLNNITGTRRLIEAAEIHACERFVMISTDKAVHPSSIMGATKRTAELLVQHRACLAGKSSHTRFACVRFGNVVGSRGSVVPIFLRQIAAGGPVTITHEEMTRYFMTIPQAVHLVLQAATLASTGDIYMLDMGDPVKIIEFARDLIRMSGLRPDIDIPIRVTGTRPGEKLHEQLWYDDSEVSQTVFPSVFRVHVQQVRHDVPAQIERLEKTAAARAGSDTICDLLSSLPIEYKIDRRTPVSAPLFEKDDLRLAMSGDD